MPSPLRLTAVQARRFQRRAVLLDAPVPDVASALAHHGYIQIDPINVAGRMHDLILRHRVAGYREGDLMRHLHGATTTLPPDARTAFEHHIPSTGILVAFPLEAWPHLRTEMLARTRRTGAWSGRLTPKQKELAPRILAEIAARGPLSSEDFADTGYSRSVWGAATQAKATMQKLFFHGRLLIARRENNRRYYDLPERVLPAAILKSPAPILAETKRWEVLLKLHQRRLVILKKTELPLVTDLVQQIEISDADCPPLHCLRSDLSLLDANGDAHTPSFLLAPLDPLIYDRRLTKALWNYDYTWEAYTPAHKRVRGYYALPILAGTELVGHVDPKADRNSRRLRVVRRSVRGGHKIADTLADFARWLGLKR